MPDPNGVKPDDWDEEEDGEWEAPQIGESPQNVHSKSNFNFEVLALRRGGNWNIYNNVEKNLLEQRENHQQTQLIMKLGPRIEAATQWWEASALTTAPPLLFFIFIIAYSED